MINSTDLMVGDLKCGDVLLVTESLNYDYGYMTANKGESFEVKESEKSGLHIVINEREQSLFYKIGRNVYLSPTFKVFLDRGRPTLSKKAGEAQWVHFEVEMKC